LWVNPEQDETWKALEDTGEPPKLFSQDFSSYTYLKRSGARIEFAAFPQAREERYDWIIVNLSRQKALLAMVLDSAAALLAPDGVLWLAGENRAGIKSANKLLKQNFGEVRKVDNARHCSLYEARVPLHQGEFNPLDYRQQWKLDCAGSSITLMSYPGVFAHGRLDEGTALLLDALPLIEPDGDVLDFACGTGVIGACIAAHSSDSRLTLLDSSALALRACEETMAANHLEGTLLASNGLSEVDGRYDLVVSNPPIHAGVKTDTRLGMRLLEHVHKIIKPTGRLVIVANVHLPYEKWLSKHFKTTRELVQNEHYKVIMAKN